jgi:hypothetical protein
MQNSKRKIQTLPVYAPIGERRLEIHPVAAANELFAFEFCILNFELRRAT